MNEVLKLEHIQKYYGSKGNVTKAIQDISFSVQEGEFVGRNICFVSISCDDSQKAWERFVQAKQLGGIQLHMGGDKSFMEAIRCKGIPRFLLIDQDGKFLNANMSRPSDGKTLEILNTLPGL